MYKLFERAKVFARQLRNKSTAEEKIFWELVRNRRFYGEKFYRQHIIRYELGCRTRFFFADFYCFGHKLVIELDGKIHEKQKEYDMARENVLRGLGMKILRIRNEEFLDMEKVKLKVKKAIGK
ncbi:MAG: hypothetical protein A2268_11815 [Candidatus Raymondbacteria bacterium RifOxyA12_full_50_37]|uniref:DUF559 domain-containing protein n=1 Tax=Candidatus Raymondbacteria bacterium RIFOXYD12_FULL_49_13 TaxID=1817890 RepID=A0A1F7FLU4_UNCRA|nr:MAG: hypothetical protein A2268_11815 [Candidatus Raymondbacteria bacterium RifOxyA12_full_50_37]OGJ98724.1 MAG: hypothetical protein A2453_08230 [Candidatus Raymondbacteria bacterium RIFOXYC2_FULL_50_21]OGJ99174.1 MAG: hypothetical protein A2350_17950 [Candidatus Raymondbacteria bacterium RifOxyB12_full_50_8]OGK07442.1 MAG: hypothetical protein A2519_11125 [Candidatus Raymondbacteria bacterium RIFOXYD12_FULL_49_13]OGK07809.1 MAG: hypothetical protein A2487_00150 [Candidatus Raymondbacteria 